MKKKGWLAGIGALALSLSVLGSASAAGQSELAQVRQVTAKYHNVNAAIADGYTPTDCKRNNSRSCYNGIPLCKFSRIS